MFSKTIVNIAAFSGVMFGAIACTSIEPAISTPLACDEGLKSAFKPDANTTVLAVRLVKKGEQLIASDSPSPVTTAADVCLVKLLVGPGFTAEKDKSARSYSEGIGIEVWLPMHSDWNERIRNYGGGGWVGGDHRIVGKIGSKVPAIVIANMGYAVGTTDAGQPWNQEGSFAFLSDGKVNEEGFRDFAVRAMVEQAVKTKALVKLYYGKPQKFAYYDGQSQGGRQGLRIAQDYPDFYDGYLLAQPAISVPKFGAASLYPQIVLKTDLGFNAADKEKAAAYATKVNFVNARAVSTCDKEGLGYLIDPFACSFDPAKDAASLCSGVNGEGVVGVNSNAVTCMNLKEAQALRKIWYGATSDGSVDVNQSARGRSGEVLADKQLWWGFPRGSSIVGQITGAGADQVALAFQDVSYASDASVTRAIPIANKSTVVRNRWMELDYQGLNEVVRKGMQLQPLFSNYASESADLRKLRELGRKVMMHNGLAEDVIPPSGNVNYYHRVANEMGGHTEVQKFLRMYLVPGMAHSSQGRASIVSGKNDTVPMPKLPGNNNQTPTQEQDQMFTALLAWVEKGIAPNEMVVTSRDGTVSYPLCVYPKKLAWDGIGSSKVATSYSCITPSP
jgi:Tannase and feruloyl esterase